MTHAFGAKPPAIAWLGQFFVPVGYRLNALPVFLLSSVVLCQAATLALVFATARHLPGRTLTAVAATLGVAGAPLFTSTGHEYLVEPLQTFSVVWTLYILIRVRHRRLALTLAQLVAAVGLGLLTKLSTPLYMLAPGALTVVSAWLWRRPEDSRWWRDPSVVFSAVLAVLLWVGVYSWYSVNWRIAKAHADSLNSTLYGPKASFGSKLGWWLPHFDAATFLPVVDILIAVAIVAAILIVAARRSRPPTEALFLIAASVATLAIVIGALALHPANEIRYTAPLVPCLVLAAVAVMSLARSRGVLTLVSLALCAEFALVTSQSFGGTVARRSYPAVVAPESGKFRSQLEQIVRTTCSPAANDRISIVGADLPFLNGNTLTLMAAERFDLRGRHCYYTPLGYAESDPRVAWKRVLTFKPQYYVSLDYSRPSNALPPALAAEISPHDPFNVVNRAIYQQVLRSPHFQIIEASRHAGLVVFKGGW